MIGRGPTERTNPEIWVCTARARSSNTADRELMENDAYTSFLRDGCR